MLQLNQITIGFKRSQPLVSDISCSFDSGKLVVLIGSNGSGKSALLKTISGLIPTISGDIIISNQNIHKIEAHHRASLVSIMLATPPTIQNFTVEEIIHTGLQRFLRPFQKIESKHQQKIQEALEITGLNELKSTIFGKLSDGQKQKVMLARCLAQDSKIILLDEPLAFLDFPSRISFLETLKSTANLHNKTILFSSHDLQISAKFADEAIGIKNSQFYHYLPEQFSEINHFFEH